MLIIYSLVATWPKLCGGLLAKWLVLPVAPIPFGNAWLGYTLFLPGGDKFYMICIAAVCWGVWTVRNKITFDNHVVRSPVGIIFTICSFILYWSGLLKGSDREVLRAGVQVLMAETSRMAAILMPTSTTGAGT